MKLRRKMQWKLSVMFAKIGMGFLCAAAWVVRGRITATRMGFPSDDNDEARYGSDGE